MQNFQWLLDGFITGVLGLILVGGAVYESVTKGSVEAALLVMATAVVSVYFTGRANKQVNGEKVDALTASIASLHGRLDKAGIPSGETGK